MAELSKAARKRASNWRRSLSRCCKVSAMRSKACASSVTSPSPRTAETRALRSPPCTRCTAASRSAHRMQEEALAALPGDRQRDDQHQPQQRQFPPQIAVGLSVELRHRVAQVQIAGYLVVQLQRKHGVQTEFAVEIEAFDDAARLEIVEPRHPCRICGLDRCSFAINCTPQWSAVRRRTV